jgi:hypothetical protein
MSVGECPFTLVAIPLGSKGTWYAWAQVMRTRWWGLLLCFLIVTGPGCILRRPYHRGALVIDAAAFVTGALVLRAGLPNDSCNGECRPDGGLLVLGGGLMVLGALGALVTGVLYAGDSQPTPAPRPKKARLAPTPGALAPVRLPGR